MTKTEARSLQHVLPDLGRAYKAWKAEEANKNEHKDEFFTLADEALRAQELAERVVTVRADGEEKARVRAALHNPGWVVTDARPHPDEERTYELIIQEDPSLKGFSEECEGVKYSRQIQRGSVMVDDEYLAEEDPELYNEVTVALPWGERTLVPLQYLDSEPLSRLAPYIYNGTPRVQLRVQPVKETS